MPVPQEKISQRQLGTAPQTGTAKVAAKTSRTRRVVKGSLPYTLTPNSITSVLNRIIDEETPDKFSNDFLETKLRTSGGAARSIPPLLKKLNLLTGDGAPTELYRKFRSSDFRSDAMLTALKIGYRELFNRNEYAHELSDEKLDNLIIEVTGLPKGDSIIVYIRSSFKNFKTYVGGKYNDKMSAIESEKIENNPQSDSFSSFSIAGLGPHKLGISYNINLVLPETDDVRILNAIFQAIKRNLLS